MITLTRVKQATSDFIKVLRYGKSDVQTAYNCLPHGIDSKPIKDKLAIHIKTSNNSESVIVGYIDKSATTNEGECRVYATNSNGVEVFSIYLKNDGTVEFGGNTDNLVRFSELKAGFDQLKSDFNTFLTHVHGGAGTPPAPPQLPSTASIDSAKIDEIKTI